MKLKVVFVSSSQLESENHVTRFETVMEEMQLQDVEVPGQNLPELTVELLSAQTFQSSELHQKEAELLKLKAELRQTQQALDSTNKLVSSSIRAIFLKEDLLAELGRDCECMRNELFILALEKQKMEDDISRVRVEREKDEITRLIFKEKMDQYSFKVKATPTQLEIESLKKKISTLKEKCNHLVYLN